jgi:hypothetical protein
MKRKDEKYSNEGEGVTRWFLLLVWFLLTVSGILRDVSFIKMTDKDWDLVNLVHVKGILPPLSPFLARADS